MRLLCLKTVIPLTKPRKIPLLGSLTPADFDRARTIDRRLAFLSLRLHD